MKYRIVYKTGTCDERVLKDGIAEWDIDYEWMTLFWTMEHTSKMKDSTIEVDPN